MKVHWFAVLVIVGLALSIPAVSAKIVEEKNGYIITTGDTSPRFMEISSLSSFTLTQGQTRWHTTYVPSGRTSFFSDLNWGNPSNTLSLTIYIPDSSSLGPYYDSADGYVDGRINLRVSRSAGLPSGTWSAKAYGASITGTQSYSYSSSTY